jgi:hypothetical protein
MGGHILLMSETGQWPTSLKKKKKEEEEEEKRRNIFSA